MPEDIKHLPTAETVALEELIGSGPTPFPTRAKREFAPWHRPRKQFVRHGQWAREVRFLVRDLHLEEGELRYLTLPGSDFLDIRHIHETVCAPQHVKLRYLGFDSGLQPGSPTEAEINANEFSVKRLDFVDESSEVLSSDFRDIGNEKSVSWSKVKRAGGFHVINLDLCGGFAGEQSNQIPDYFTSLRWLLNTQAASNDEFLLFVTTRTDSQALDAGRGAQLIALAQDILETCPEYAEDFARSWGSQPGNPGNLADMVTENQAFMLGFIQWIVNTGVDDGLKVTVKGIASYNVNAASENDDLMSVAIRFKPNPTFPRDRTGIAQPFNPPNGDTEICVESAALPSSVKNVARVDSLLRGDPDLFRNCVEESERLLASAGYDSTAYREWVLTEPNRCPAEAQELLTR